MQDSGSRAHIQSPHPVRSWVYLGIVVVIAIAVGVGIWWAAKVTVDQQVSVANSPQPIIPTASTATPQVTADALYTGYDHIWEIAFLPSKEMLFTERKGVLHIVKDGKPVELARISDVRAKGEGGLLGLAVDPSFVSNRYIYTCFNSTQGAQMIHVVR
ncbi:MAG TPA: PQQ-dependent sugar dehydrogenase, partial [Candidatus Saccharimonadales bacterium]|nr:PQQ-dependent sugar dehydrogenase [Candidatus Saccharimonadales bacterium]